MDAIGILSLLRTPTSYFRPYRNYFICIFAFFLAFPIREIVLFLQPEEALLLLASTRSMVVAAVTIAILWGHLCARLYLYPKPFSIRAIFKDPSKPIHIGFFLYLVPMAVTLAASLVPGSVLVDQGRALYPFSGGFYRAIGYSFSFLGVASSVIAAFVSFPLTVLAYLRSQLKDREVRHALRIIAAYFGAISIMLLAFNAVAALGYSILGIVHVASVTLLIGVVHAFSRPTFLRAFLGMVPSLEPVPTTISQDLLALIYGGRDEKFGHISRYMSEHLNDQVRVVYFHPEDETIVTERLSRNGINVRQHLLKGNLRLLPLAHLYQGEEITEEEAAIASCLELTLEAKSNRKEGLRIIIDYGDLAKRLLQKLVEHLTDARWTVPDHYLNVVMAIDRNVFRGQEDALAMLRTKIEVLDVTESVDMFSRTVGLLHNEIAGRKILLEYDPLSDYDKVLSSILAESTSNFERIVVFTRRDSPLHSFVRDLPRSKTFVLTTRVSYPKVEKENRVLLPIYDTSLLLDAFSKTIEAYGVGSFTIIFDSISHYIYTLGPERTYSLVKQAMELMISDKITAVFMLNAGAHDQKTVSMFQNLFDVELLCRQGARVPEARNRLSVTT